MTAESRPAAKRATIYDVALLAGVSHQTVSRVVKGHPNVRPEMRERIEAAIAQLSYRPNQTARTLATSRSNRLGALVYELLATGPSRIVAAASVRAREAGYVLDIVSLDLHDSVGIADAIGLVTQSHLAGVFAFTPTERVVTALHGAGFVVPLSLESESSDWVGGGSRLGEAGVDLMIDHLADLGHRRFFLIGGPADWLGAQGRRRAYDDALARRGLVSLGVAPGDWSARCGYEAAAAIPLAAGVTAVIAANDQTALGAIAGLAARGVRVPDDVSVVGFDDIAEAAYFSPALTTVHYDFERYGRILIDRLLGRIIGSDAELTLAPDRPAVVVRASTAAPRG